MTTSEWLTWDEAAALVGCPVPTIDWHKRTGRIVSRGGTGRASLERASVEEFATWWAAREAARAERKARSSRSRKGAPERVGWLTATQAADVLGCSPGNVGYLLAHGRLPGTKLHGRWWVRASDTRAYALEESRWISQAEAGEIIGVSTSTAGK